MSNTATFQTRARTVDHLGRGQIADCPTAVSELWKNGFDAYAENVELHIFDGNPRVASITDDGCGMTRRDFLERWLVLGTESKVTSSAASEEERFGLPKRPRQGEKGIGRLSAAFLAPVNLIISKKRDHPFMAALVDWRLFENPYLALEDLRLPVEEVERPDEIVGLIEPMLNVLRENLTGGDGPPARAERLQLGWRMYSATQLAEGKVATADRIAEKRELISERHLKEWLVYAGLKDHGTALFMSEVHEELGVWVDPEANADDDEVKVVKRQLKETLNGFTDPYSARPIDFSYEVLVHHGNNKHRVISSSDGFSLQDLRLLEHLVEGSFDDSGAFHGKVKVLGKDRGELNWKPARSVPRARADRVGAFEFCIGTFEQELSKSTHSAAEHAGLLEKAENYSGLAVYRDELRVMPYGRPDSDFFEMEQRRGKHAGREFWAHRRNFGRVTLTRAANPNLRDKAGREGLIDNRARREMKLLVIDFLMHTARRYFGTDSEIRQAEMDALVAAHQVAKEAAQKALARRNKAFRRALILNRPLLEAAVTRAGDLKQRIETAVTRQDPGALLPASEEFQVLKATRRQYDLPPTPPELGSQEESFRSYRDDLSQFEALLRSTNDSLADAAELLARADPEQVLRGSLAVHAGSLGGTLDRYERSLRQSCADLIEQWGLRIDEDRRAFDASGEEWLRDLDHGAPLSRLLKGMDEEAEALERRFAIRYDPLVRTLETVAEGIDMDSALMVTENERQELTRRVQKIEALAQLGIAVEIIGHELETLDEQVKRNLLQLPANVRSSAAYQAAFEAHRALADQLRFLAPLNLAGYRARQTITGKDIADFIEHFFGRRIQRSGTTLIVTNSFRNFSISDLPSRIYPVFVNLINNSLYWLKFVDDRRVQLDRIEDKVIVADSGRGVDRDDIPQLFELFFTRRAEGRGVGLYLSRANLAVAHHAIRYARSDDPKVMQGANFILEFKGMAT